VNVRRGAVVVSYVFVAILACSRSTATSRARTVVTGAATPLPVWLTGLWTREWIERAGERTSAFDVHYLQTPLAFADVRLPRERSVLSHARSFSDLTDMELHVFARQRGFTGFTTMNGALATSHHEIDFQPADTEPDIGRLERIDDAHILEHAPDSSYTEAWRSLDQGETRFLSLRDERDGRLERVLLVAGDHFLFVRNRAHDLPAAKSLDSLISSREVTRSQMVDYLDCDFSTGLVRGGSVPWEIQHSTLPWREGSQLEIADSLSFANGASQPVATGTTRTQWLMQVNTFTPAELQRMFAARP